MIDVLIIGSGGAGLSAALSAKEKGANVLVVSKTYPTHSQTVQAQGGINAVLKEEKDSILSHTNDTYNSSKKLSNIAHIKTLCSLAKDTIKWLDDIGVPFSRSNEGEIKQRPFGGTKAKRTCYSSDYTGLKIVHTLYDNCLKNEIDFLNEHILLDLIVDEDRVIGAVIMNLINSEIKCIYSKTIIIATGGYANIYNGFTTNSASTTGDGISIAFRNGAKLSNMEFIQFHPTALKHSNTLISESARAEGAYLVTKEGKRFVNELETRDKVARAIKDKILINEEVYLDMRHLDGNELKEKMPQEIKLIKDLMNLNVSEDLIPINPAAHYTMGGILTNVSCETSIKNLYAIGECAQANIHGANRLGGNSLLEIITLGRESGVHATKRAREINEITKIEYNYSYIDNILENNSNDLLYKTKKKLGKILFKSVGLYRNKNELEQTLDKINQLIKTHKETKINDKSKIYNKNLLDYIEVENMLEISKLVTISAIKRDESRGSHFRKDIPEEKESFEKISTIYIKDDEIVHKFEEIK